MDRWQERIDAVWGDDTISDDERIRAIDALALERAADDPVALFERAGARDSAGAELAAKALYRQALDGGLDEERRVRATIQLASTLRNLGEIEESLRMLREEHDRPGIILHDEVAAFYALALASSGDTAAATSVALETLAPHLSRYHRSVTAYARALGGDT
ncbi:tetratricopeptide (TPR) repeat protein [Microbacterium ginsengiterrae]|uniref:Tetratricopeptide (TPR) repeat protein n=1 Tax=Microbacterium ginsengiterrae TaxID=546115 RepID=A0A7W9C9G7_9MICO|nr:tetratricopeptide repeat protein [Microbacterium ginsengiterrae]MBB5741529.1 tetratricopeptide (TPR) repeat protein [Microbacterium ginsengiterrae]